MDPFQGIMIEVTSGGMVLPLYDDPDKDASGDVDDHVRRHYIESTTGAAFGLRVTLERSFALTGLRPDDAVRIYFRVDNFPAGWVYTESRDSIERLRCQGRPTTKSFERLSDYDPTLGQHVSFSLSFSALDICDDIPHSNRHTHSDSLKGLGSIEVEVKRIQRSKLPQPQARAIISTFNPTNQVSEKMLKGKSIADNLTVQDKRPTRPPSPFRYYEWPVPGLAGRPIRFEILYRSKASLQSLGCIPRAPTPEPVPENEIRTLRARLAKLERQSHSGPKSEVARWSNAVSGMKRELDDEVEVVQPPRTRTKIESIDLTGD